MLVDYIQEPFRPATFRAQVKKCPDTAKYKTEMCRNWIEMGFCPYGSKCNFAHGNYEILKKDHVTALYKTKSCVNFQKKGYCPYGWRCMFQHPQKSSNGLLNVKQTVLTVKQERPARCRRLRIFQRFAEDEFGEQIENMEKQIVESIYKMIEELENQIIYLFLMGLFSKSDATKRKEVIKQLSKWAEQLEKIEGQQVVLPDKTNILLPQNMNELMEIWRNQVIQIMVNKKLQYDLESEQDANILNLSFEGLARVNINKIQSEIQRQANQILDECEDDYKTQEQTLGNLFVLVNQKGRDGEIQLYNYATSLINPTNTFWGDLRLEDGIQAFHDNFISVIQKVNQHQFEIYEQNVKNEIHRLSDVLHKEMIDRILQTNQEEKVYLDQMLSQFTEWINQFTQQNHQVLPPIVFQYCQDLYNQQVHEYQQEKSRCLRSCFHEYSSMHLNNFISGQFNFFDSSVLNEEIRHKIAQVLFYTKPEHDQFIQTFDQLLTLLNLQAFNPLLDYQEIQQSCNFWQEHTNTQQRVLTLTSLYLSFQQSNDNIYPSIKRVWLIKAVALLFNCNLSQQERQKSNNNDRVIISQLEESLPALIPELLSPITETFSIQEELKQQSQEHKSKTKTGQFLQKAGMSLSNKFKNEKIKQKITSITNASQNLIIDHSAVKKFSIVPINSRHSSNVVIAISGWLSAEDNFEEEWAAVANFPNKSQTYALHWDSNSASVLAGKDIPARLGLFAISALNPILLTANLYSQIKHQPFVVSERKARRVGRKLAEIIQRGEFGRTSIVLIGFSLGTRVINYCLKSLYETAPGIISEVYLLGGASPNKTDNWQRCKQAVSGRFVNAYSTTDKILKIMYRASMLKKPIGNSCIEVDGIENYNVTHLCSGHLDYRKNMEKVLEEIHFNS